MDAALAPGPAPPARTRRVDRWLGALVGHAFAEAPLRFALRDGTVLHEPAQAPVATVRLADRAALAAILREPETRFGDAYAAGRIDVEGDLVAALEAAYAAVGGAARTDRPLRPRHSLEASRDNVTWHYDRGNDFYRLWLDEKMLYTCAYFPHGGGTLEQAQLAKMDHVCRKLRLVPGERVVEAGCGWGALALHMAGRYGVRVTAYNVSVEQVRHARRRAREEGLDDRVQFVEADYRHITGRFDAAVSLGMLEHVGRENFAGLGRLFDRCLDPQRGRGLLHFIGRDRPRPLNDWIERRIFPGAYPPTLAESLSGVLEPAGFSVIDVENLRPHYAQTLRHWRERFEAAQAIVRARYGDAFTRAWRLYLAGSEAAFRTGWLQLFQVVFARPAARDVPWSRAGLYAAEADGCEGVTS
jgi:cyclopropane-fatty-acyl-phospholipid synthase